MATTPTDCSGISDIHDEVDQIQTTCLSCARQIQDPIHGHITLSPLMWRFIDTRHFQRLRAIKQLGTSYYVWAGASHNRFEHCIGVAHLARTMIMKLKNDQPELGITDREVTCVELAGLCHDLGHGPWSHVWDSHFIPEVLSGEEWSHEDASEMMFDDLIEHYKINISQEDIAFVKDLIKGYPNHSKNKFPPEKPFLFEIVANKRNGIDVDKFDYLARDIYSIGESGNISAARLIDSARVIDNEICYNIKNANSLYELCYTRFSNHKRIYSHKTAKAIEHMIVDGLKAAEPYKKIAKQIKDPSRYVYLTDDIMPEIERSQEPELADSRAIFDRIRTRQLYKCVDYKAFEWSRLPFLKQHFTPEKIVQEAKSVTLDPDSGSLSKESCTDVNLVNNLRSYHVIVSISTIHYGMQDKNPLDYIKFFSKRDINTSYPADPGDFSTLIPHSFGEVLLRVYTRDTDYTWHIQQGYRALLAKFGQFHDHSPTPPTTEAPSTPRTISLDSDVNVVGTEKIKSKNLIRATPSYPNNAFMSADKPSARTPKTSPIGNHTAVMVEPVSPSSKSRKLSRKRTVEVDDDTSVIAIKRPKS